MSARIAFTPEDWDRIEQAHMAWWAGELERPLVLISHQEIPPGRSLPHAPAFTAQLPLEMPAEEVVDRYEAHLETWRWHGDAYPKWWINFGPGIMAGFLGSRVEVDERTVWFEPARLQEISQIHLAFDEENVWWQRVKELTRAAAERWQGQVCVGYSDLGGNLDILASLCTTEKLLTDLLDEPDEVARLVKEITRLWIQYFEELHRLSHVTGCGHSPWAPIWSIGPCYMLQCDFSYMISPEMFERFVLPDLCACCDFLEYGFYHLDGKGQIPHLEMLLDIPRLRGVQWIPGAGQPPADQWPELLARIRAAGKLCQVYVSAQGALRIAREHGGKGFLLHVSDPMTEPEAREFLALLAREDRIGWGEDPR